MKVSSRDEPRFFLGRREREREGRERGREKREVGRFAFRDRGSSQKGQNHQNRREGNRPSVSGFKITKETWPQKEKEKGGEKDARKMNRGGILIVLLLFVRPGSVVGVTSPLSPGGGGGATFIDRTKKDHPRMRPVGIAQMIERRIERWSTLAASLRIQTMDE